MDNETKREFLNHILSNPCNIIGQVVLEQNNTIYVGQGLETAAESMDGSGTAAQKTGEQEAATGNKPATADIDSRVGKAVKTVLEEKLLQKNEVGLLRHVMERIEGFRHVFANAKDLYDYISSLDIGIKVSMTSVKDKFYDNPKFDHDSMSIHGPDYGYAKATRLNTMYRRFMEIVAGNA